jgi:type I restriction enzyme, S subunit
MRPYIRAANVGWDGLKLDDVKTMNFTNSEMVTYELKPGDLLLGEASGSASEVGKPAMWSSEIDGCAFQNTLLRVRAEGQEPRYLLHYFKHVAAAGEFAKRSRGVGIIHLGREALASWIVPLPPIEEQRRIVAILDKADELRAKRRATLTHLGSLTQSIFVDMFGGGCSEVAFAAVVSDTSLGLVRNATELSNDRAISYLRMNAITRGGELQFSDLLSTDASYEEIKRYSLAPGDLLFNTRNSRELVGKVALFRGGPRCIFNNNLMRIRLRLDLCIPEYAAAAFRSPRVRMQIEQAKAGTTSVFAVYASALMRLQFPLPPLAEQRRFAANSDLVHRAAREPTASLRVAEELFASLQQRAFAGEL